jgi:hypothetical protein
VSYTVLSRNNDSFDLELRLEHAYRMPRTKHTDLGSGMHRYEFMLGATFVEGGAAEPHDDCKRHICADHISAADIMTLLPA